MSNAARGFLLPQEPFSAEEVIERCKALQGQPSFQDLDKVLVARHDLRHRLTGVDLAGISEKLEYRSPAIDVHSARYANRLDKAGLIVQVAARAPEHTKSAQSVENWDVQIYHDFKRKRAGQTYAADRRALDQQAAAGFGIRHIRFTDDVKEKLFGKQIKTPEDLQAALGDIVEGGFRENPFTLECPDVRATFWEPNLRDVCEVGQRKIATIYAENGDIKFEEVGWPTLTSDTVSSDKNEYTDMADVWHLETSATGDSPGYIYDVVSMTGDTSTDSKAVMLEFVPNPAGRPWYTFAPGQITASSSVVEGWQPLVGPLYPIIQDLNLLRTLAQSGALITGRPQWQEVANSGAAKSFVEYMNTPSEQRPTIRIDLTDEMLRQPRDGFHWEVFPVPDQTVITERVAELEADIVRFGFPAELSPSSPTEATSGFDRTTQQQAAADFLEPPLTNLADAWREIFLLVNDIIKDLNIPVTIPVLKRAEGESRDARGMITLKPEDLRDYDLLVRFEAIPVSVRFAKQEADIRMWQIGQMSEGTLRANAYDDPVAEGERIERDQTKAVVRQKRLALITALLDERGGAVLNAVLAEEGVPLSLNGGGRRERPAGGSFPNLGSPSSPPVQTPPGEAAPPGVGGEITGEAQ